MPASPHPVVIGLAQFTRGLNLTRQRFGGRRVRGGSVGAATPAPEEPADWQVLPYAAGLLQAYVARHADSRDRLTFLPLVHESPAVPAAADALGGADIAAFSAYVWNVQRSLAVAHEVKTRRPDTLIVFGGPQVPDRAEPFLRAHPFIDIAVHGEGERPFTAIVDRAATRDWQAIAGVSYLRGGHFVHQPPAPRTKDLDTIPSPYLDGVFDAIIDGEPRRKWVMLWETNRGCPFACTFCDWGSAVASKVYQFAHQRLIAELEWFADRQGEFIFCCDANFGLLPRDVELARDAAAIKRRRGFPRTLSVQNTKNATDRAYLVQKTLADAAMNAGVTLSLQSTDRHTLKMVKRDNISLDSFRELQRRYALDGIPTYTDMILGLPGETYDSFANGISAAIAGGQHTRIHFYNCSLLPNAEMSHPDYRARHGLRTVHQVMLDMHGAAGVADEPAESLEIAVATDSMPADDWVRAKTFAWMTDLLHFDRLLVVPMMLLHNVHGLTHRAMIESVMSADAARYPTLAGVQQAFAAHARRIAQGGPEYLDAPQWLGLRWPADQHALITLATSWHTDPFYDEALTLLSTLAHEPALRDAVELNRAMLRLPFEIDDAELVVEWNVWDVVQAALAGAVVRLEQRPTRYRVERTRPTWLSWDEWLEHVIFCQNQKPTYLYPLVPADTPAPVEAA